MDFVTALLTPSGTTTHTPPITLTPASVKGPAPLSLSVRVAESKFYSLDPVRSKVTSWPLTVTPVGPAPFSIVTERASPFAVKL